MLTPGIIKNGGSFIKMADKPFTGSMHKFSDGYGMNFFFNYRFILSFTIITIGYGVRYLTSRNQPTVPSSVPMIRHEPLSDRYLRVTSCTKIISNDFQSQKRNADQIKFQTSGEIGKFYVDSESEGLKVCRKTHIFPTRNVTSDVHAINSNPSNTTAELKSHRDNATTDNITTHRLDMPTNRSCYNSENTSCYSNTSLSSSSTYLSTLKELDKSFGKVERRDLAAACLPPRSVQELRWGAASNNRGAQQSKLWAEKLRKESS